MNFNEKDVNEYFYKEVLDFDESTILSPNINGNKENGEICKSAVEINDFSDFCKRNSLTANDLFLASVSLALNKFNFSDRNLIYHSDNLPLPLKFDDREITVKEYLSSIQEIYDCSLKLENESFVELLDDYNLVPEFYYSFGGRGSADEISYSNFLNVCEDNNKFILSFSFNDQLYTKEFAELFLKSIEKIIKQIIVSEIDEISIRDIALVDERDDVVFDEVELPYLHKHFENQAKENPDSIALVSNGETLTYAELNEKANRIANGLIKKGVEPKSNVLIMLPRTSDLIASIWGVLKAGCAFIPMDMEYPQERIDYIYENSQAPYIISNESGDNSIDIKDLLMEENVENPDVEISPEDLAYMIYTSGSTGKPKGVMISHRNICNLIRDYPKTRYDRILSMTTISFDVALEDILTSLTSGMKLIFANDTQIKSTPELVKLINEYEPEVMDLTPSRLVAYLEVKSFCEAIKCLKCIFLGGEKFSAAVYEELIKYNSDAIVYNSYGPTETTITSNNKIVTDINDLTVGPAIPNYLTDVRDIDGKLLPQGVMGELYIGGPGVGKGYYNMEEKTGEVFLKINEIPYYRSGDYAIETPNGEIDIKGRIDNQIKLRGLRIEIGEIESNLGKYPNIKQNVVVIKEINNNEHLCAYFTAQEEIDVDDLKEYLKERLTRYMVPTVFMQLDEMPQTPNGKTDIKQLPEPELRLSFTLPETETEEILIDIASRITETPEFGTTDDLYAVGFTSLTLMKLNAAIYEDLGVNLDIIELLNNPTIRDIAKQVDHNERNAIDLDRFIEVAEDTVYYPLTSNQLGVYYECVQSSVEAHYNLPSIIRFDSDVNAEKLKDAIIKTIEFYPYLKTRIVTKDGQLMQKRDDAIAIDEIPIVEVDSITDKEIEKESVKSFDLQNGQLFRFKIYKTSCETILFSDIHHLISDGESLDNLFNNVAYAYEGRELENESIDGYINSLIEKEYENSEDYQSSHKYFQEMLSNEVDSTVLTPDLNGNEELGAIKSISKNISPEKIREFCSKYKISPNVLIMASAVLNLNKYTFTDKTLITTIFNGRSNSNYFNTQAFLVKTLPFISFNENRSQTIRELLESIDIAWKDLISHSTYPYTQLAEEFQLKPEFFYSYNNLDDEIIEINAKSYRVKYLKTLETNYKITFDINESADNLEFLVEYNDQLYSKEYVETFLDCILNVLDYFMDCDIENVTIRDIELNGKAEIPVFSPIENPFLHKRFEKQVEENPNKTALIATDATLTYRELDEKANRIANALIKKGVEPGNNILVMLNRNSNLIASIFGILKAGCAFIPIDLEYPQERIDYIYENSQADYIISNESSDTTLNVEELLAEDDCSNPDVEITSDYTAYMIYTSGSTGKPKGVMISHKNICNLVTDYLKTRYDKLLSVTTISFDVALEDIFTSLTGGVELIFADDAEIKSTPKLIELINKYNPEVMDLTPSRLASYLDVDKFCEAIKCLKVLFLGGEQFSAKAFAEFRKYSDAIVYNSYGPTETTITSNNKEVIDINNLTVGHPVDNYVTDVRDIDGKLLPQGVMGELYIGGPSVGKGYYNMPEKTKEVFLTINDIPYYRSGDYAIETPNGEIDIKGRIDNQIKLRGLRIEIGEIESNIGRYPGIKQNVVVIKEINNNDHLCAYFTADDEIDAGDLKEFLKDKLTKYMVPTVFMQIDEMPQTPNGKTDIKQLPEPVLKLENVKPENETEEKLFEIASNLINTDDFGITDDLYVIGYTSLTLMKLNSIIYDEMGVNLDISVLFNNPTIKKLSIEILNGEGDSYIDEFVETAKTMEYFPLTENQLGIYYECIRSPNEIKYTMPTTVRFGNEIDPDKLKESIIRTIEAHPYLKTRLMAAEDGTIMQHRNDEGAIDEIEIVKVDEISDEELIKNEVKAFSLNNNQLFRFKIYDISDGVVMFSDFHHIITDGVSQGSLFDDIARAYDGKEIKKEIVDGFAYSLIENDVENSEKYETSKKFFHDKLSWEIDSTILTPNLNGNEEDGKIKRVSEIIDSTEIKEFCRENSISQNALFLATTILNLNKYTFSDETLITTIFNGRANPNYYDTQGFLVKTLPLVMKNEDRQQSVRQFIRNVDVNWKETINNSDYPYTKISEEYQLKPEFFYSYQEFYESESMTIADKSYSENELIDDSFVATEYKTDLSIFDFEDTFELHVEYNDELYSEGYIETFLNSIKTILTQIIGNDIDELRICDIELEIGVEMPEFSPVELPFLHKRFERQVNETPDGIALIAADATLTYRELDEKANRIANALIKKGVEPGNNILVMLNRNSNLIASIFGILKAGCAFIPIDLEYPRERIDYIYENSQADYIISNETSDTTLNVEELLAEEDCSNPDVDITSDYTAYMIYTSGSTGKPKGVMISHANISNLVEDYPKTKYDRLLSVTTISFDVALEDIFTSLTGGVELIFADDAEIKSTPKLIELINKYEPEVMDLTPSRLASYLDVDKFCEAIKCLKVLFLGGEQFSAKVFTEFRKYGNAIVYNSYGPTETTITSNNKEVIDIDDLTVGPPIDNYVTDVRDIDGKLLPQGVMGELYIGGPGVGKGYYNMPEKTEEVFLTINDIPYYRSGDYAIETPNGEIDIKGRIDNQIKLRGLRIEIGEIESNIGRYPGIKQNVVVIKEINDNDHLCAYFTADIEIDEKLLKDFLNDKLTRYMIPTVFMQLDEMPQTPNGKTDLKQLPEPQLKLALVMPETETEEKLFDIVSSIVDVDEFGVTDDLYAIGFTSLTLMKLNSVIYEQMGANLDISILFNEPTVKNFAIEIDNSSEKESGLQEIIKSAKGMEYYPLTENQLGIYYECKQNPDVIKYTMPTTVRFDSDIDANKLKQSVIGTIEAHPYIKTRIVNHDGDLKQKRCDDVPIDDIEIVKVDSISDEDIIGNDVGPIPIEDSQLFKFKIYETPDEVVLFSDFHHIITDGVSQNNLFRDIADIYENRDISEEIIDGYTYSILEKDAENSETYQSSKAFFDDKLTQGIESTVLTPDLNGNPDEGKIRDVSDTFDSDLINEFCNDNSISKNALFIASTILNLNKFTFSDKSLITTIFNGRSSPSYFNTQGFLVKTIPFIINNENRHASLRDFIKSVDQTWKDTLRNSAYPYIKIAEKYQLKPEFFYNYHEFLESDEMIMNNKEYVPQELAGFDMVTVESKINLAIYDNGDEFNVTVEYNDQLYSEDYVNTFIQSLKGILLQFLENDIDSCRICDVKLKDDVESHEFIDVEIPFIHKRFEKQVDETPQNIALVASDASLTYSELNQKANRVANALINRGIKANSNVLVMLPRDSNLISAILGVLKAGCAFIPIDINYPKGRIDYIFENSQADYIISDGVIENSIDINELLEEENTSNPHVEINPDDLAYMIYTSGSTGNPKGVMTSHMNITNLFSRSEDSVIYNAYSKMKKTLALSTVSFDAFLLDFMPLTFGLEMVLANDSEIKNIKDLAELVKREKPDSLTFTAPSRFKQYLEYEEFTKQVPNFRYIGVGGEMVPQDLISRLLEYPDLEIYNIYGPTETTVTCNTHKLTSAENITVGKALHNCITEVRDIDGKLLPSGVMGELYIGGNGVSRGYYNMDEKTKEVFLNINDVPYYRSGDYAIELPNGELVIKGRIDNQIKLRGLRIELGEIESNIARFPHIKQIVVVIDKINDVEHLCAYFTADEEIDINLLRRYLKNKLTEYMVPTVFMQLDEMPISPNGKTDIKRLPKPKLNLDYVEAEGETEEKLVELVASIANTTKFGTTDDLYQLGFSSLTLMKLNSLIFNEMNVNIDVTSLFTNPTIKSLADRIDNNIESGIDVDEIIETAKDMEYFPLTANQMGIYYECMQTEKIKYTMPSAIRFDSSIDPDKLKDAIIKTVDAHPYLKTRIINADDGKILQKRCDDAEIEEIEIVEIDSISNEELIEIDVKPIPLDNNQLFRFKIYKTPTETVLFVDFHHIITDGESQGIFFSDLAKAYNNEEIEPENVNGFEYSLIEEETSVSDVSEKFFKKQFSQEIESTVLTPNINGNPDIGNIKAVSDQLGSTFVRHFCKDHSISSNTLFMAATLLSLNKFTFSDKSLITTIFNGRANSNYSNTQGMLVKTLPVIVNAENRDMMVEDYIKIVDKAWKDALVHSDYPYTKLSEEYQLKPEFFYAFHEFLKGGIELNGRSYEAIDLEGAVATDYKINLDIYDDGEFITLYLEYNDQIYTEEYVNLFVRSIKYILFQFFVNDMDKLKINDIELVEGEIPEFEEIDTPILHKRFEKQVVEKADDVALVACDATLTYAELNDKSNRIANALIKKGVEPGNNVLVMLNRNSNLIASIFGILKAGCVFIPIDLEYPQERIDYIYENSQADYIISDEENDNSLNVNELLKETNTENPDVKISPDDLAYMIYTSGSTGNPKGVMISHENIANQVQNPKSEYESLLCLATISFDVSVDDILTSLTNGLKLILASDTQIKNIPELIELISGEKPEVSEITPSRLASYLEVPEFCEAITCLKCVFLGGEQFSTKVYENFREYSNAVVYNSYGPTETTITSNNKEITDINDITVGYPLDNYVTDVRDIDGKLLPHGVMGELYIGGVSVGKGYYNMPEKTKEVFLTINDIPYYRSGDYAIETPNGEIDIKGRIDNQIKLRGLRIEIGEIESNIGRYPGIKQNVVVIKEINNNDHLCAYFTADDEIDAGDLKDFLKDKLTKYMVPTVFMQIDEMPQTPNGKTDIKQLPEPVLNLENVKPENETEEKLFEIASELIETEEFGVTDDLYSIGFTSLTLMKLNSLIYNEMNANIDISVLFNEPSIRSISDEIRDSDDNQLDIGELIEAAKDIEYYPLTENQLGVYYECIQNPDDITYVIPTATRFGRDIDAQRLKQAIITTIEAHPYLKTRIMTLDDGSIKQKRDDDIPLDEIEIVKVDSISNEELAADVSGFALGGEQLFKFKIYETTDETVLFANFHHLITDGMAQDNLFSEIMDAYEGKELPEEQVDGYIYSLIEEKLVNSEKYGLSKKFFSDKLSQEIESSVLTPNLNGNPDDGKSMSISQSMANGDIQKFCNENAISQNALLMACTILTLNKYTYSGKTLITAIFNGRALPYYQNTQAFLVKTLPIIMDNEKRDITIKQFIEHVDKTWKDSINHIEYPYTKIAEEFQLKPEFFYTYQEDSDADQVKVNGENFAVEELGDDVSLTEYKITLDITAGDDSIDLSMKYNDQLYTRDYAELFLNSIIRVLTLFVCNDINETMISDISLVDESEKPEFKPVETPFIHKRFENQVLENPDAIALRVSGKSITYSDLNERANRIANALIRRGVEPRSNVLVMLKRDVNLITSVLGILKAGCAYIPIDLEYPQERIEYIYKNSQAEYILAEGSTGNVIDVNELLEEENIENPDVEMDSNDLAYMIYTSGSTGKPKGVMISHKNITSLFAEDDDNILYEAYCGMNKTLAITTISFDTFLLDLMSLTFGLEVVLANDNEAKNITDLTELIRKEKPDALTFTTPSRLRQYLENDKFKNELSTFNYIAVGGEMLPQDLVANVLANSDAAIYNIYGPTETTVTCNSIKITDSDHISVGKALHNYVTDVRDIDGKLLPKGVMGELYIGGVGVSKGYYNLDDKTEEVFLEIDGVPYYRSGDYAIELPNGEFDVKGRIDNQIKLRGLRIEIGEIEANINRFPKIKQSVTLIREINNNEHLCTYFTAWQKIDINLLKRYLKSKLTKYMVPTVFIQIDEMPQTPNGKTDIKQLPEPTLDLNYVGPESELEEKLFEMVSSLNDNDQFGTTDDLYSLGFTSLTLMKLNSLINQEFDVNIDMASLFSNPTIKSIAFNIENDVGFDVDVDHIREIARDMEYFPLTANQLGIYYECVQSQEEVKYTLPSAIRFGKDIDSRKLRDAVIATIEAHPYLKTRIVTGEDGELKQKRCDDAVIDEIEIVKTESITNEEIMKNDSTFFELDDSQLFRFKIYETPSQTILFSDFHHIISDGESQNNFFNDLIKVYKGEEIDEERIDGYVYSLIEQETSESESSKKYFQNKFSKGFESTVLTTNINGDPDKGNIKLIADSMNSTFIRHFCKDHAISLNVLFMTAVAVNLNKFTFSDKALITTIFNGRANSDYMNTQGMLVKTLPVLIDSENRDMMVEDFIKVVDEAWKGSLVHSNYPYTKLSEEYQLKPEFFYAFHEFFEEENVDFNDQTYDVEAIDGTVATDYKINLNVYDDGEEVNIVLEYNDQLYTEEYVQKFLHSIKFVLIQLFVNDMDKLRLRDIELEPEKELHEFVETDNQIFHERFERQVDANPDKTALVACDAVLTYRELDERSNRIANALIRRGVEPRSKILVMLPRTSDLISAIFGILKAGSAYVPIDLAYPKERVDYIYNNSQADYIIGMESVDNTLAIEELLAEENGERPDLFVYPEDLAYMIYTSGSTGNPKGVMISHKNVTNLFVESEDNLLYNIYNSFTKALSITTVAFDPFLLDLSSLIFGLQLVLASDEQTKDIEELTELIKREKPDAITSSTHSRLRQYLEYDEFKNQMSNFKYIGAGGEMMPKELVSEVSAVSDTSFYNTYGPTETTVASNALNVMESDDINVGKPLFNYITDVRDLDGKLLPQGVMGELYIGGPGVGKGYYNMDDKTKEVFLEINKIPYYRSGDYAIELPNGEIDVKGRIDNQIKLRGLRIEIDEIESNISDFPNIKQNVVLIKKINNTEHLCAYFTAEEEIDKEALKNHLKSKLTQYMVPTVFMQLDEMPQTPNGKTDVKALPEPKLELKYVAPANELEQLICSIFSITLDVETVGAEDNFFEIGGTSLIASKLIIELLKRDYVVKYDDIFRNQTPRQLARVLSGENKEIDLESDIVQNYDYTKINELLSENTLENFANGKKEQLGNVLLTGVTGFLGIHILYEFIKNETGTIYCMLRKGSFNSCEERLIDMMDYYFDEDFSDLIGSRIILSEGDITSLDDFNKLKDCQIDTLINSAALVKHFTADDYIYKVNVDGVINGLKFAESNGIKYVQISTISVLSPPNDESDVSGVGFDERTLYYNQDLTNKYINSKFLAERMVLEYAVNGLNARIVRVGNLMARYSDGLFQKNFDTNAFLGEIRAIKNIQAITEDMNNEEIEMSPIDYVAKATLALAKTPMECRVFNCVNPNRIYNSDIIEALNSFGYDINLVSDEEFIEICRDNMDENIQGLITSDMSIDELSEEELSEDEYDEELDEFIVKTDQTKEILHSLGVDWPILTRDYLRSLIKYLNKFNYFE